MFGEPQVVQQLVVGDLPREVPRERQDEARERGQIQVVERSRHDHVHRRQLGLHLDARQETRPQSPAPSQ